MIPIQLSRTRRFLRTHPPGAGAFLRALTQPPFTPVLPTGVPRFSDRHSPK